MTNEPQLTEALFNPRAIALVGASGDPGKYTSRPQRFLRKHGFPGAILPINPGRREILGERSYARLRDAPGPIDHVFIMVPTAAVASVIEDCCDLAVPLATIFTDGFAEVGAEGRRLQDSIVERARAAGVRLLGPNCLGVLNTHGAMMLTANAVLEMDDITRGTLGLVSQSGSMMGSLLTRAQTRGIGFSKLVSVGNEADLGVGEITELLVDDPDTQAILLFLETLRDADRLASAARRAHAKGKPVIAYKLGRSAIGRDLATTHTGALAGSDEAADAFFRAHGIIRVHVLEALLEMPPLVAGRQPLARGRVAVMTTTGGGAATVVDQLGIMGVEVVPPPDGIAESLAQKGIQINRAPIIDLTMAGTRKEVSTAVLNALLSSDHCDAVLSVGGGSSKSHPQGTVEPLIAAPRIKPLAVFVSPQADVSLELLRAAGIAGFRTPEACADALRALCEWKGPAAPCPVEPERAAALQRALEGLRGKLDEIEARRLFAALAVPQVESELIETTDGAPHVALPFPVAAKLLSPDIPHKTEAGAVVLDIPDVQRLALAVSEMQKHIACTRPGARVRGVLVQRMERGLAEAIVGYRYDPQIGPVVMVGAGGRLAELYRDVSVRLAPVTLETARSMIEEVRGLAPIRGYRSLPRGDCEALARVVHAVSLFASVGGRMLEAELNPVIVKREGQGVVAVDALARIASRDEQSVYSHPSRSSVH